MKCAAILPCLNEREHIFELVSKLHKFLGFVIVVDDSSTDDTIREAERAGAYVIKKEGKYGFGSTLRVGMRDALSKGFDVIVTLDGDGQHDPSDALKIMLPIEDNEADIVIGSRFLSANNATPMYRKLGIGIITWLYNVFSQDKVTDSQCCLRAYRKEVLQSISMTEDGFTFSTETLICARKLGFRIREVPVKALYHKKYSQNSTLNPIKHGLSVAWGTIKLRLKIELLPKIKGLLR